MQKAKTFQKKKSSTFSGPNATGPGYRSPSRFSGNSFSGKSFQSKVQSATTAFKTQHKG